jgi:hypothetical protein
MLTALRVIVCHMSLFFRLSHHALLHGQAREAAAAARTGGLAGPSTEVLQLGAAFLDGPEAGDALVARMQAFMWA